MPLNGLFLRFKCLPVALLFSAVMAAQQHILPFLGLQLEIIEQLIGQPLMVHVLGNVCVVQRQSLLLTHQAKQGRAEHQQQGASHEQGKLVAEFHKCTNQKQGAVFPGYAAH